MGTAISTHYYQGAYGPTIRIGISTEAGLSALKSMLNRLACGEVEECRFDEIPSVAVTALDGLYLKVVPRRGLKSVRREEVRDGRNVFTWSNPRDGWTRCVGLLDGMAGTVPCHQYLSEEGRDDALILVAYGESVEV